MAETMQLAKIIPLHEVRDLDKLARLTESMEGEGWTGAPLVVVPWCDGYRALTGSHRYAAACAADLYEIPVECVPGEALSPEQWEDLDLQRETSAFSRTLEGFAEEGAVGLAPAISLLRDEGDKESS